MAGVNPIDVAFKWCARLSKSSEEDTILLSKLDLDVCDIRSKQDVLRSNQERIQSNQEVMQSKQAELEQKQEEMLRESIVWKENFEVREREREEREELREKERVEREELRL